MTTAPLGDPRALSAPARARRRKAASASALSEELAQAPPAGAVDAVDAAMEDSRALERSLRGVIASLQRALEDVDPPLTPVQLWCLRELEVCGSATVKDLAEAIGVVPSTVSRNADRLIAAGLISRRTSHGDRRLVDLKMTRAGTRVLAEVFEARAQTIHGTVATMDSADRAAFRRGAEAFAAAKAAHDNHHRRL